MQELATGVHHHQADVAERVRLVAAEREVEVVRDFREVGQHDGAEHMAGFDPRNTNLLEFGTLRPIGPGVINHHQLPTIPIHGLIHRRYLLRRHKIPIQRLQIIRRFIEAVPIIDMLDLREEHLVVWANIHLNL